MAIKKMASQEQIEATEKVYNLRELINDRELEEVIGLTRKTIYVRLQKNNWKKPELKLIKSLNLSKYGTTKKNP